MPKIYEKRLEEVNKLFQEHKNKLSDLENTKNTTIHEMWSNELDILEKEYTQYKRERNVNVNGNIAKKVVVKKIITKK